MTKQKIIRTILVKQRELEDLYYYMSQMIIDGHFKLLFPCTLVLIFFILGKFHVFRYQIEEIITKPIVYLYIALIPYLIYRIYDNRKIRSNFIKPKLLNDENMLSIVRQLNRKRKVSKRFIDNHPPWKYLWQDIGFVLIFIFGAGYNYYNRKSIPVDEVLIIGSILVSFMLASMFQLRRDSKRHKELQNQIYMKVKNQILDYLVLSNINPFNHATSDKNYGSNQRRVTR